MPSAQVQLSNDMKRLYVAIGINNFDEVRRLINSGVPVNGDPPPGSMGEYRTPLRHAIRHGSLEMVDLILALGARGNDPNILGSTHLWAYNRDANNYKKSLQKRKRRRKLVLRRLVDAGLDINRVDRNGESPLWHAMCHEDPSMIKAMIELGADPDACLQDGKTPLVFGASTRNKTSTLRALLAGGANPNVTRDYMGRKTPVGELIKLPGSPGHKSRLAKAKALLEFGAKPDFPYGDPAGRYRSALDEVMDRGDELFRSLYLEAHEKHECAEAERMLVELDPGRRKAAPGGMAL